MKKESGIYKIEQVSSGKVYIGSSKNMYARCHRHMSELRHRKHYNEFLQRTFDKYGEDDFKVKIVEKCDESSLLEREQYYIDLYLCFDEDKGFNLLKNAYSPIGIKRSSETIKKIKEYSNTEEQKLIRKKRMIEKWKDPEYRNFQLNERKERYKNQQYVNKRKECFSSEKYKEKRSKIAKDMWKTESSREKLLSERKERWRDEEYRKRLSESAKKKWQNPEYRRIQSEKFSLAQKKRSKDPEYIKACSDRAKAQWAERKKTCSTL